MAEPTAARIAAYARQARQLFPLGLIWAYRSGTTFQTFVEALAVEFARTESRFSELELESDPRTTTELLVDWERNLGLPGTCAELASTTIVRRAAVTAKLAAQGGQSPAYYEALALTLGWAIEIEEHCPPGIGEPCNWGAGQGLTGNGWQYAWTVHAPPSAFSVFQSGQSASGDPLTSLNLDELLECTLTALAPAHTVVRFEYDLPPAHGWGPWEEIQLGPLELKLVPLPLYATNPY